MIKKIIEETLQDNDNKFSSKKLTTLTSFAVAIFMALYDMCINKQLNLEVFLAFIVMAGYQSNLSVKSNLEQQKLDNAAIETPVNNNSTNIVAPTNENITVEK